MKRKGQALVEFVMILPVIIYLILGIIDFAVIISNKQSLESKMDDVITLYNDGKSKEEINKFILKDLKKVSYDYKVDNEYVKIILKQDMDIITPGLEIILGSPYFIEVERVILNES